MAIETKIHPEVKACKRLVKLDEKEQKGSSNDLHESAAKILEDMKCAEKVEIVQ
jgi:hypothetical protein